MRCWRALWTPGEQSAGAAKQSKGREGRALRSTRTQQVGSRSGEPPLSMNCSQTPPSALCPSRRPSPRPTPLRPRPAVWPPVTFAPSPASPHPTLPPARPFGSASPPLPLRVGRPGIAPSHTPTLPRPPAVPIRARSSRARGSRCGGRTRFCFGGPGPLHPRPFSSLPGSTERYKRGLWWVSAKGEGRGIP